MRRRPIVFVVAVFLVALEIPMGPVGASPIGQRGGERGLASSTTVANYLSAQGTATVDGVNAMGEWDGAARIDFAVNQPPGSPGSPMPSTLLLMNDESNMYVAFLISRSSLGSSSVDISFDNDADGTLFANGDDVLLVNPDLGGLNDEYSTDQPPCPAGGLCEGISDTDTGGTNDGLAATTNDGTYSFYEMSHPLDSSDDRHDFSLTAGDLVGAFATVRFCDTEGCTDTVLPGQRLIAVAPLPNGKANQRIFFPALPARTFGDAGFRVAVTTTSRQTVSLVASGNCVVSNAIVVITGAGSCRLTASQGGDAYYNPAADVTQGFTIAKATQSIDFPAISKRTVGAPDFGIGASASSGLMVHVAAVGRCALHGTKVHLLGMGTCTLTASQPGDSNYLAAEGVTRTFQIGSRPPCRVPNVIGKRLGVAKRAIERSHCATGRVSRAYSQRQKKGIVISQSRRAGRKLPFGSKIGIVVSRGRRR